MRSYVLREGRLTPAQRRALDELWPRYGVEATGRLDLAALFGRAAPVWLEVGFGTGDSLLELAARHPDIDLIGIDVHRPGIGRLLRAVDDAGLDNVRVIRADAGEVVRVAIPAAALARVMIWFPDPWPKKRHRKRRLVQAAFVDELARVLGDGGILHLATDWDEYAEQMRSTLAASAAFEPVDLSLGERPRTRFERRGERRGHRVHDLVLRRVERGGPPPAAPGRGPA